MLLNLNMQLAHIPESTYIQGESGESDCNSFKDNMIPRHLVQTTHARLTTLYASNLCQKWVEDIEPIKHIYEDLTITAFLIELWRSMYGVTPARESEDAQDQDNMPRFPGFVDVACGNGVLVYVLLMEGYPGCGFDARRRKTWSIFPRWIQERLAERIYIPKPFADAIGPEEIGENAHTGDFPRDTFIISNHADELTVWTPLMAALACPELPLPFFAIPCCSHSLSGSTYRYLPPKRKTTGTQERDATADTQDEPMEQNPQPGSGDLRALRAARENEKTEDGMLKSMYGSLTAKTMSIAEEVGYKVEKTQLRIPSTRNMGVVGARRLATQQWSRKSAFGSLASTAVDQGDSASLVQKVMRIVERECSKEGGIQIAARMWMERAQNLHHEHGKGKQAHG